MKFEELMDKYKKGKASESEIKLVLQEIERFKIIEEYLAKNIDLDFKADKLDEDNNNQIIKVKESVNSGIKKIIMKAVAVVLVILIGIFFIVSPIINRMYYDPTKQSVGENKPDIFFDLTAETELNYPGYNLSRYNVEELGFGQYDIFYSITNQFTQGIDKINLKIKRNQFNSDNSIYDHLISEIYFNFNTIRQPNAYNTEQIKENKIKVMNHVKKLNPISYVKAYLTFEEDLTMEELYELVHFNYHNSISFVWAGVRVAASNTEIPAITGFNLTPTFEVGVKSINYLVEEKYPAFNYGNWITNPDNAITNEFEGYELHYKSLLKYMIDRENFVNVLDQNLEYYKSALDYVEENDVKSFGILVYANAENLIELVENESIKAIEINQVIASRRYIQ